MRRVFMRIIVVVIVCAAFNPVLATAQTPVAATPSPDPSFDITITELGVSVLSPGLMATPVPAAETGDDELVHALLNIEFAPGVPVPPLNGMRSVLITVQQGSMVVSASAETAQIDVGTGDPVRSGDGAQVLCERHDCALDSGQDAVLGPGNGLSVTQGSLQMEVHGDVGAVVQMSVLLPRGQLDERCWICPTV